MKMVSTLAVGVALALGGIVAAPAVAQKQAEAKQAPERKFDLSKEARKPLAELQKALEAKDEAAYASSLAAAQAAAKTPDDRYVIGQFQLRHGIAANNDAEKLAAVQAMVQSGGATQEELPVLYQNLGALAYQAKNYPLAIQSFQKHVELAPNDSEATLRLAQVYAEQNRSAEAVPLIDKAIATQKAAGQQPAENLYKLALKYAYEGKKPDQILKYSRDLIGAYPNPTNWRDGLVLYRDSSQLDKGSNLDLMRLMRASKSLNGERDWYELADTANDSGLPGEAKAVIDEGIASKAINPGRTEFKELLNVASQKATADRASLAGAEKQAASAAQGRPAANTADAYLGYGEYEKAAALYRTALQKGSVDTNVVNTRLGIALALAGHKAEAETALKAVTGPRSQLASFWLLWLSQRA